MYVVICCEKFILNFYAIYNQILILDISIEFFCIDAKRVFLTGVQVHIDIDHLGL